MKTEEFSEELIKNSLNEAYFQEDRFINIQRLASGGAAVFRAIDTTTSQEIIAKTMTFGGFSESEAFFLKRWSARGIAVPKVHLSLRRAILQEYDLLVLEKIQGTTVRELADEGLLELQFATDIAEILACMHEEKGTNVGRPVAGAPWIGQCDSFLEEIKEENEKRLAPFFDQLNIRRADLARFWHAVDKIDLAVGEGGTSLTHSDMNFSNVLLSHNKYYIIDPNCRITHPALCASLCYINFLVHPKLGISYAEIFKEEYLARKKIKTEVFDYALLVRGILTATTWQSKRKFQELSLMGSHPLFQSLLTPLINENAKNYSL